MISCCRGVHSTSVKHADLRFGFDIAISLFNGETMSRKMGKVQFTKTARFSSIGYPESLCWQLCELNHAIQT